MKPVQFPFASGWFSFDLRGYRECNGTYCLYAYETQPPIDMPLFQGNLDWLVPLNARLDALMQQYRLPLDHDDRMAARLEQIKQSAKRLRLTLPPAFLKLMQSRELQNRIPSCTACFFGLSDDIIESPLDDGGYLVRFLVDQQWVLVWYLYLTPNGAQAVVVSEYAMDFDADIQDVSTQEIRQATWVCGETFESFLYRFWLENTIWYALHDGVELNPQQHAYVEVFRSDNE